MQTCQVSKIQKNRIKKVHEIISCESPARILDIGCSNGYISSSLINEATEVYGIDISQKDVSEASTLGLKAQVHDVATGLPFENEIFDIVIAAEIIEHLIDTDYFLKEIYRVLKKDGKLILTTPNIANLENRLRLLIGKQPVFFDCRITVSNHLRAYTPGTLKKQLQGSGFKIEVYTGSFVPAICYIKCRKLNEILLPFLSFLAKILPNLSLHLIIKAQKKS